MKRTYIAGKITGLEPSDYLAKFHQAEKLLEKVGHLPVNPCRLPIEGLEYEWEDYITLGVDRLLRCEAIYLLSDWKESRGARIEHAIAMELGLEIIYSGEWDVERTASKVVNAKGFISFAKAKKLNNSKPSKHGYLYDRFAKVKINYDLITQSNIMTEFEKFEAQLPKVLEKGELPKDIYFILVPVDTFDSQEQIDHLIGEGKFYYA